MVGPASHVTNAGSADRPSLASSLEPLGAWSGASLVPRPPRSQVKINFFFFFSFINAAIVQVGVSLHPGVTRCPAALEKAEDKATSTPEACQVVGQLGQHYPEATSGPAES